MFGSHAVEEGAVSDGVCQLVRWQCLKVVPRQRHTVWTPQTQLLRWREERQNFKPVKKDPPNKGYGSISGTWFCPILYKPHTLEIREFLLRLRLFHPIGHVYIL